MLDLSILKKNQTYFAHIGDSEGNDKYNFLGVSDGTTTIFIDDDHDIEKIKFGGQTWYKDDLISLGLNSGVYLGSTTFATLEEYALIDTSNSGMSTQTSDIASYLSAAEYNSQIVI